jgi:23S rRNA-/tRNA-specific pseudouridylate synthase
MERLELTAAPGDSGRLDAWLAGQCPTLSRSALQNLIEQGLVTCGGAPVNKKDKVAPGKVYAIDLPDPQPIEARPQNIPLDIVYEDDDLLVVNKPKGMVVHPAPGNPDGTLVNALLYHCAGQLSGIGGAIRPGIVHRIDKDTSGLLVVAKNDAAHQALSAQMSVHSIHRVYHAVVYGNLKEGEGFVEKWLGPAGPQENGRPGRERGGGQVCLHGLAGAGTLRQFHVHCVQIKDRAHPSDSCTHGLDGASVGRGCCVRPQKLHQIAEWPVPARQGAGLCPPADRGVDAV